MGFATLLINQARSLKAIGSGSQAKRAITLLTFDVDGTLIHGSAGGAADLSAHAKAFSHAVGKVFNNHDSYEKVIETPVHVVPSERYHGSTDGLIAINFANIKFGIDPEVALQKLPEVFQYMDQHFSSYSDEDAIKGIEPLPGVIECLQKIKDTNAYKNKQVLCGLVTGNVEGIARKKMRATGIFDSGVLTNRAEDQIWSSHADASFLGGFGSDYCSGEILNPERYYKDRGEQIGIAFRRANQIIRDKDIPIQRAIHIGDAPNDVLAAKWCAEEKLLGEGVIVGCIAVATGKYSANQLRDLCGDPIPGQWEPMLT
eukprot:CAMPEP_0182431352 /NCGR_PEP_ID=MMETSP1167-20130531/48519_1 /TAXON_ID=2988 /ORGANISM="Mallomonas Sp, Strain CCMP3275" /LENGTH=314 /DNA_ID=CAMNT_0024617601 /DNA_START=75 /DNA_END=1019 /DNA_ORIENTATION=+